MIFTGEEREWGERGMEREGMTGPPDFKTRYAYDIVCAKEIRV